MIGTRFFQIVDCNALPMLILLLGSEDATVHYEAVRLLWDPLLGFESICNINYSAT